MKRLIVVCMYLAILLFLYPMSTAYAESYQPSEYERFTDMFTYYPLQITICMFLSAVLGFVLGSRRTQEKVDSVDAHMDLKEEMERKISALRQQLEDIKVKHNL